MPDIPPEQTVTLPGSDWQTILAGLYELPGKYGIPVINRLQTALTRPPQILEEPVAVPHHANGAHPVDHPTASGE